MSRTENATNKLQIVLENMVAEGLLAREVGVSVTPAMIVDASRDMLLDVIRTSLPLAHLVDTSDLILHAEGPAVREDALRLSAVNWVTGIAERTVRRLSTNLFEMADKSARTLGRKLDLRLTGLVPGSLYVGIALGELPSDLIAASDDPVTQSIREAIHQLPVIPHFVDDESINQSLRDEVPDPARRDSMLNAMYSLAPTGKRGIHTLDLSSPGVRSGKLSQRERVVLRDALERPTLFNRKEGSFTGELREIDLDASRFHLRDVAGVGSIKCVLGNLGRGQAKRMLGEFVRVSGEYETDREGRPRLMLVKDVQLLPRAPQAGLLHED